MYEELQKSNIAGGEDGSLYNVPIHNLNMFLDNDILSSRQAGSHNKIFWYKIMYNACDLCPQGKLHVWWGLVMHLNNSIVKVSGCASSEHLYTLSVVCPTLHTLGGCWKPEENALLESSSRDRYLVETVLIHSQTAYTFFFIVSNSLENSLWIPQACTYISPCHTLCMTGRYQVFVKNI